MARVAASAHLIDTRPRHADPSMRSYISEMVRIAISQAAFDAIAATMPLGSVGFDGEANERGRAPDLASARRAGKAPSDAGSGRGLLHRDFAAGGGGSRGTVRLTFGLVIVAEGS